MSKKQSAFQSGRRFFYILLSMFEIVKDDLQDFEAALRLQLDSSVAFIDAISEDLVSAGGKRIRPSLAFIAGKILGCDQKASMTVALAV